jgi:hypothetical protein
MELMLMGMELEFIYNYKVVDYEVLLDGDFKGFEINLEKG